MYAAALGLLGLLAAGATLASEMPRAPSMVIAAVALIWGGWRGWQECRRPVRLLCVDTDGAATLDGEVLASFDIRWRGPLGFVRWRDAAGRGGCLIGAPDVFGASMRRDLRLVDRSRAPARPARSMAP